MRPSVRMFHVKQFLDEKCEKRNVSRETTGLRGVLARGGGAGGGDVEGLGWCAEAKRGAEMSKVRGGAEVSDGARRCAEMVRAGFRALKICKNVPRETKMPPKTPKNMNRIKIFAITEGNY